MGALTVGGESDPVIPPAQQRRCLRLLNDVNRHIQVMRRFDRRINNLYLFSDYTHDNGHPLAMSRQEYRDHPLVQVLLERRDRYLSLKENIAVYEEVIRKAEVPAEQKLDAIAGVVRLKQQQSKELEAMEIALIAIRKDLTTHLHTCQKFVTDVVKISQLERLLQHKTGNSTTDLPDDAIDAELAKDGDV